MRRWVIAAVVLLAFVAVGVVAIANLNTYLNRNRDWLAARAEQALGREVQFSEIGVSLTQGFGVRVRDLRIADDPAFSNEPVVSAADAIVRVRIIPALFGRYEISRVVLAAPVINVVRTKAGLNLSTLGTERGEPRGTPQPKPQEGGSARTAALVVAYLSVDDGTIHFVDRTREPVMRADVSRIDFSASDVRMDRPLTFRLNAAAFDAKAPNVHANGSVGPLPSEPGAPVPLHVDARADRITVDALQRIPQIAAALPADLSASGPVSVSMAAEGTTAAANVELAFTADEAHVRYGSLLDKAPGIPLRVNARAKTTPDTLAIEDAKLALHTGELGVKGTVPLRDPSAYDLAITAPALGLGGWERVLPALADFALEGQVQLNVQAQGKRGEVPNLSGTIALRDGGARGRSMPALSGLTTTVTLDGDRARVEPAKFMLAGAPATLKADVKSLRARTLDFGLDADEMHLAAFERGAPSGRVQPDDVIRNVAVNGTFRGADSGPDAQGHVTSSAGTLHGLTYENLVADVHYANGRAVLDPFSLASMGGTLRGKGVYEFHEGGLPTFQFESQVHGVRAGEFAAAFGPAATPVLEGNVDADLTLAGAGSSWSAISHALTGNGRFGVRDGALKDINLVDGVLQGLTGLPGLSTMIAPDLRQKYPRLFATNDTRFDVLQGTFRIADGRMSSDNLALSAADYAMNGRGGIGFDRSVDMAATLALSEQLSHDLVQRVDVVRNLGDKTGRIQIPFRLAGTLPAVRPRPDIDFVAQAVQRAAVDGLVGRILENEKRRGAPGPAANPAGTPGGEASAETTPSQASPTQPAPDLSGRTRAKEKANEVKKNRPPPTATEKLLKGMGDLFGR